MKLKSKLKLLVTAVTVAFAGQAAAMVLPSTGNSDLWLSVWDSGNTATGQNYTADISISYTSFLGSTFQSVGTHLVYTTTTLYNNTFATGVTGPLLYNVFGGKSTGLVNTQSLIATFNGTGIPGNVNTGAMNATFSSANTQYGINTNPGGAGVEVAVSGPGTISAPSAGAAGWGDTMNGLGVGTSGVVGPNQLAVLQFTKTALASSSAATNSTLAGFFSWDGNGHLNYTVPGVNAVPVPAAALLFGSGLFGLAGVARRRKNKTQAA